MNNIIIPFRANLLESGTPSFANISSLSFDGVDDYVSAPQSFLNSASVFSMSFWAKKPTAADILNIGDRISVYKGMWLSWYSDSNVYFQVRGTNESMIFSLPFDTDWHHFLCTFNNGVANVYVDGILKGTFTFSVVVTPPTTGDNFRIGSLDASNFGNSTIDEVALWNSVVPIGDVWDGSGAATDLSLLATPPTNWYRNGDNGSWKSPQWLIPNNENFAANKVSNYSFQLDGVDDRLGIGTALSLGTDSTISFWIKRDRVNFDEILLGENTYAYKYTSYITSTNHLKFQIGTIEKSFNAFPIFTILNDTTNWINICWVRSGDSVELFLNGVSVQTHIGYGTLIDTRFDTIGATPLSAAPFLGNIDEVAGWNTNTINPLDIYNGGTPTTIVGASSYWKMGEDSTFAGGVWTVPDNVGSNDGSSANMTIEDRIGEAPNSTNNAVSLNMDFADVVLDVPPTIPPFNTKSLSFDGVDDFVSCGNIAELSGASSFTYSGWYKQTTLDVISYMFGSYIDVSNRLIAYTWSSGLMYFQIEKTASNMYAGFDYSTVVTAGQWFHLAVIYDGSGATNADKVKIYIDGVSQTLSFIGAFPAAAPIGTNVTTIGKVSDASQTWNGSIDEVCLLDRVVTPTEIVTLSTAPTENLTSLSPLAWYRNGDGDTYPTITDNGSGGNSGTMTNMDAGDIENNVPN